MQHLQPNTPLQGGKYRIERVLGQGGFGITYLAEQVSLNRKVAIKEFFMKDFCSRDEMTQTMTSPSTGSSKLVEQYRRKFIKEARNLARLNYPNIINVIDVFEENDTVYYVMPYLAGGSLQDYVKTHGVLSEQEAMKYIRQIARALKYMHEEQNICHYDVKPANILLDDKGNAVLIDFGISKNYDAQGLETTTTPIGVSEGYAPIEQYQQNVGEFSPVSDVYALGATLYFLLHGKRPVSAIHRASGAELFLSKQISQSVKDIINASMKISKRERASSMDVFMGDISTSTYMPSSADTSTTGGNRDSSIGWIIGIVIAAVIGFIIYNNYSGADNSKDVKSESVSIETSPSSIAESKESTKDIYKERVEQFARKQNAVVASYPNDKRYSVYYSKKDEYGHKYLYHYDGISGKSSRMELPIAATGGEFTSIWVSHNKRYIFVAAEYRYTDFIRIDTETKQVMYITECHHVKRSSNGFIVTKAECYNEYEATGMADMLYEYTDYYYDEEGNYTGNHGSPYR